MDGDAPEEANLLEGACENVWCVQQSAVGSAGKAGLAARGSAKDRVDADASWRELDPRGARGAAHRPWLLPRNDRVADPLLMEILDRANWLIQRCALDSVPELASVVDLQDFAAPLLVALFERIFKRECVGLGPNGVLMP